MNIKRKKIVMLPLDERPCNYLYPLMAFQDNAEYDLILPPREKLGKKKQGAKFEDVREFLLENGKDANYAVISIDMLLYGGLLAGRLHNESKETLLSRLSVLRRLKEINPTIKIFAAHLIMRCPSYSTSQEEPEYYGICGEEIFRYGEVLHKQKLGICAEGEEKKYLDVIAPYIDDFTSRRKINLEMNKAVVDMLDDDIDVLIIPQDDSSPFGFVAEDQKAMRDYIAQKGKQTEIPIYPGADEIGLTLLARVVIEDKGGRPRVSVFYSSEYGRFIVPNYEDRYLCESVKLQLAAAGCSQNYGFSEEDDILLAVNTPSGNMLEAEFQGGSAIEYNVNRTLSVFARDILDFVRRGKTVAVADVAYSNGSDLDLLAMLDNTNAAFEVASYAAWNTSGNSLGTTIATAVFHHFFGKTSALEAFIAYHYYEDGAFCAKVRQTVGAQLKKEGKDMGNLGKDSERAAGLVQEGLRTLMQKIMPNVYAEYDVTSCIMPWNRMFETELTIKKRK